MMKALRLCPNQPSFKDMVPLALSSTRTRSRAIYGASKFAVHWLFLLLEMELAEHGIAVTTISPDAVQKHDVGSAKR